jgi:hydrogenase expression/formation protein HypE
MKGRKILLGHGSGGKLTHQLIEEVFLAQFKNHILERLDDSAVFPIPNKLGNIRLAYTTDSYVVTPIFFPGGDIGKLAVYGTINDLSMVGAEPLYITTSFILEEGFPYSDLERILYSMKEAAEEVKVNIVAGDTKVVPKGNVDKVFINTSGIGIIQEGVNISASYAKPGDVVIINGSIGEHGLAILLSRENLGMDCKISSDLAPLSDLVKELITNGCELHVLRDPTRGGLATALNEIAKKSHLCIEIDEDKVPIKEEVKGACELLGFDPLYLA